MYVLVLLALIYLHLWFIYCGWYPRRWEWEFLMLLISTKTLNFNKRE